MIDWLNDWLVNWLIDVLIDWLNDWLVGWLIDWCTDWLIGLQSYGDWGAGAVLLHVPCHVQPPSGQGTTGGQQIN